MTLGIQQLMQEIERLRDGFHAAVYAGADPDAALADAREDCTLVNLPMHTGARGRDGLRRYLVEDLLPHLPGDLTFRRISRTVDKFRVVEEATARFTHDCELPWLLPGVAPTHRRAEVLAISVVGFAHSRINAHRTRSQLVTHRTFWDHSGLLAQLGLATHDLVPDTGWRLIAAGLSVPVAATTYQPKGRG